MKRKTTRFFAMGRKARKGAGILRIKTFLPFRTNSERRLRWLLGFALESSELRTPAAGRRVHAQVRAYLGGLHVKRSGEESEEYSVGDPLNSSAFPMGGAGHQRSFDDKLELIRADVRLIVKKFLGAPNVSLRVTGEITWQRILDKDPGRAPTFREHCVAANVREGITFCLLEDLAQAGTLVRQCPATGCGTVFVRRYRQEFCSTACRNRTNFHIWYQRTRKQRKRTLLSPHATRRKRPTHLRRARIMGKPKRRTKYA